MTYMDMEKLNKSQIVMLTLLTSFVTSIATGIVTVSLMEQAPPVIPQTINRVVERTVEKVIPQETQTATVITKEKTVTVRETDLIAQAVSRARSSTIKVHGDNGGTPGGFISRGVVISKGYVIAPDDSIVIGQTYYLIGGEKAVKLKAVATDAGNGITLLSADDTSEFTPAVLAQGGVVLGQTVVGITGINAIKVTSGIVTGIEEEKDTQKSFEINIDGGALTRGATIVNVDGALIGMYTKDTDHILPAQAMANLVSSLQAPASTASSTKEAAVKKSE